MKKTRLIPFTVENFKKGMKPVCNGEEVKQLTIFECNNLFRILGVINGELVSWKEYSSTLFLEQELEEKTIYLNIYEDTSYGYENIEKAKEARNIDCLGILKITYTEEDLIK